MGPTVWSHENGRILKARLQIAEDLDWKVTGSKLGAIKYFLKIAAQF